MSFWEPQLPGWRDARRALSIAQLEVRRLRAFPALRCFNPSQPRVPAGHPDGGQWTDGDGSAGSSRIERVSSRPRQSGGSRVIRGCVYETTPAQDVQRHDPNWQPTPSIYEGVEGEILANESMAEQAAARLRELGRPQPGQGPLEEILLPNGQQVGVRYRSTDDTTRTVTSSDFNSLLEALTPGSQMIPSPVGYRGFWYRRPDGSNFGVRRSEENGITIDVIRSNHLDIPNGYKVHQQ